MKHADIRTVDNPQARHIWDVADYCRRTGIHKTEEQRLIKVLGRYATVLRSVDEAQSTNSTMTPGLTIPANSSASQFVKRTHPCDPDLSIIDGSGVPWIP